MSTETCSGCGAPVICGHSIALDQGRRVWRICCLCTAELISRMDAPKDSAQTGATS